MLGDVGDADLLVGWHRASFRLAVMRSMNIEMKIAIPVLKLSTRRVKSRLKISKQGFILEFVKEEISSNSEVLERSRVSLNISKEGKEK